MIESKTTGVLNIDVTFPQKNTLKNTLQESVNPARVNDVSPDVKDCSHQHFHSRNTGTETLQEILTLITYLIHKAH